MPMSLVMKILILNPHIDAQHKIVRALKARGDAVFVANQAQEAWQILQIHSASMDIAVIHREGAQGGDPGVELNFKIKKNSAFTELPVLFTAETWSDAQCATHQQTPMGANAYLHWPFEAKTLIETLDAIFGGEAEAVAAKEHTASIVKPIAHLNSAASADTLGMVLEDPSEIFSKTGIDPDKNSVSLGAFSPPPPMAESLSGLSISQSLASLKSEPIDLMAIPLEPVSIEPTAAPAATPAGSGQADVSILMMGDAVEIVGNANDPIEAALPVATPAQDFTPLKPEDLFTPPAPEESAVSYQQPVAVPLAAEQIAQQESPVNESDVEADEEALNSDVAKNLPYLFEKRESVRPTFAHPVGDAVVPGGASNAPDTETLKKYLQLREQDVAALSGQLRAAKEEGSAFEAKLIAEKSRADGLELLVDDQQKRIEDFEKEKAIALEALNTEIAEIRFQSKAKTDKAKLLEMQVNEATQEIERVKERVRSDIRKIRVRERELENKLELGKRDFEVVLNARENKIIELKRKIDLLEFNMDLLQERFSREKEASTKLREKLSKAAQVVRVAEGLLDEPQASQLKATAGSLTGESSGEKAS
jgi:DNA-binding response OmpR family regulator